MLYTYYRIIFTRNFPGFFNLLKRYNFHVRAHRTSYISVPAGKHGNNRIDILNFSFIYLLRYAR